MLARHADLEELLQMYLTERFFEHAPLFGVTRLRWPARLVDTFILLEGERLRVEEERMKAEEWERETDAGKSR
jgi:hypothetical protein